MNKIGVIGVGIIASSVVEGFCTSKISKELEFFLSPRNAQKAEALKDAFPEQITVCQSNQEVADEAEIVIVALHPSVAKDALSGVKFRKEQKVISFMCDLNMETISGWLGEAAPSLTRMVPLPLVTTHEGPILIYPAEEEIVGLFSSLGELIPMANEDELTLAMSISGLMSVYYQFLHTITKAAADYGLSEKVAMDFTTIFINALNKKSQSVGIDGAKALAVDEMTPGGLNELSWEYCMEQGTFEDIRVAFDKIMERMKP